MIVENIDGVDKGINDMPAEEGIVPVAFGELAEEEENAIMVHQLGL
jgi:hypothetical protein